MKKAQKRFFGTALTLSTVASVVAPVAVSAATQTYEDAKAKVDAAKATPVFSLFNTAYEAAMNLTNKDQQAELLNQLAPLWDKVNTPYVQEVLAKMEALAKDKNLKTYHELMAMIDKNTTEATNKAYLGGELYAWGTSGALYTADEKAAIDAINKAWTDKTPAALAAAKEAAAKVTNAGSLEWLNGEIANVSKVVPVSVDSVKATAANTFKVKFTVPVADTAKVTFDVKRATTPVTPTITWNAEKTEATLTNSANFPEGTYTVAVKNDTTDLGTSNVQITAQKVAKINITSTKLAVSNVNNTQKGYATYTVLDQYGKDITGTYLANSLTFQTGVGAVTAKDGVLTITPATNMNLITFSQVVITGYDSTSGVSTSATLATSTAVGTLNGIELKALTNADNKVLTAQDNTTLFYISFSATDTSDNVTTDYNLVKGGLVLNSNDGLTVTSSYVTARLVQDPTDSKKAAIEVKATDDPISMDLPISITAMTYTGKSSTLNLTLKKQAAVDTFTLMAPAYDIAVNERKEIPFVAYNQNGIQITKFSELDGKVTFSTNQLKLEENVDGTAKLVVGPFTGDGPQIITASTQSGKMSSLTLNIQKTPKADTLEVSTTKIANLQVGANQKYDFYDAGGLTVKDQYGRDMDLESLGKNPNYKVVVETTGDAVEATGSAFNGENQIVVTAKKAGTATVIFSLIDTSKANEVISKKSVTYSVIKNEDIKGYVLDTVSDIYAAAPVDATLATLTDRQKEYKANPKLYGTTASGAKVKLFEKIITGIFVDNSTDFIVLDPFSETTTTAAFDAVKVVAKDLKDNKTSASTKLTVTFKALDGSIKSLATDVKSTTAKPVAASMGFDATTSLGGVSVDGDVITVTKSYLATLKLTTGNHLTKFTPEIGKTPAEIVLWAKDQYGKSAVKLSYIGVASRTVATDAFDIDANGKIIVSDATKITNNSYITITGVTSNGLAKTIKIVFVD